MIQETYKISLPLEKDGTGILQKIDIILENVRNSDVYQRARGVYVKLLMAQVPLKEGEEIDKLIREGLPKAAVAGMTQTVIFQETRDKSVLMSICYFKQAAVTILYHEGPLADYGAAGREFGQRIAQIKDARAVEMFCVAMNTDLSPFILEVSRGHEEIPFYGSLAGMNRDPVLLENAEKFFSQEQISLLFKKKTDLENYILGNGFHISGIVMVVFSGEDLHVQTDYLLGWKPLGKEMVITEAPSTTCVSSIDNIPAVKIFQKYLNIPLSACFLMNVCDFPMVMRRDGLLIARTPPIFDRDGRLYFGADIHEGEHFRLAYANPQELLRESEDASRKMQEFHPDGVFLIICPNRTMFLKEEAPLELAPFRSVCPQLIASYGPGEIYRYQGKGGMLNSSFLAIGMREGPCPETPEEAEPAKQPELFSNRIVPLTARLAAFLDATTRELRESNRELKDMAEIARAASLAKSQFLSNMSHEIRTPINAILGMDEMILREAEDETILEYAENIRTAGSNLLGLINDILDFSKIESGKLDIIPVEYDLSSVLNDLVNMIQHRVEKKGLLLAVKSSPDLPSILYGDEIRIKQIVTNILTNAVKYTHRGFVALSVDYTPKDKDTILLRSSVKDTGIGIKEEDMKKLFCAFERIEEERNRTIEGTGLGLNITKHLLSLMNSKLDVKSEYGKGSTFSFTLEQKVLDWTPMGDFDEAYQRSFSQREKYHEEFTAPDARILVVDDTAVNLTVVKGLLKQTKVRIDTAESGKKALELVMERKYDIIFLDHRMPGMDGIETLKAMQVLEGNPNHDTPVISLTANAVSGARKEYIAAGFKDYLTKPINSHDLEDMILKYLPPEKVDSKAAGEAPAPEPEGGLPEWLSQISDLDTESGIQYCGSEEAYLDALTVFAESIVPGAREIAKYYETEDWQNFTTKVHALKSTARLIGAKELSERAKALEDAGNKGAIEIIRKNSDDLLQLYLAYATKFAPLCDTPQETAADKDKPMIDEATLAEAYETLEEVAASFDYDSLLFVLQSLEDYRLPEPDAQRCTDLRDAARKPDWEKVRNLLAERKQ